MKVYTKQGDNLTTGLIGSKTTKDNLRIKSYGALDEAMSFMGLLHFHIDENKKKDITMIMKLVFLISQDLANNKGLIKMAINSEYVTQIENLIDEIEPQLIPLKSFIYPIGSLSFNYANIVRTTLRRAETNIVELAQNEDINLNILPLVNRLSDYFYVLGRLLNKEAQINEEIMDFNI